MECFFQVFQVFGGDGGIAGNDIVYNAGAFEKLCDDNRCRNVSGFDIVYNAKMLSKKMTIGVFKSSFIAS